MYKSWVHAHELTRDLVTTDWVCDGANKLASMVDAERNGKAFYSSFFKFLC